MAKVREVLAKRKREHEATQSWFECWYSQSPSPTTLVSSLTGPLILFFVAITFRPYVINKLLQYMGERLYTIQLMAQRGYALVDTTGFELYANPEE